MDIQLLKYIYCDKFTCTILVFQHKCHLGLLIAFLKLGRKVDLVVPSRDMSWSHSWDTWWVALPDFLFCFPIAFFLCSHPTGFILVEQQTSPAPAGAVQLKPTVNAAVGSHWDQSEGKAIRSILIYFNNHFFVVVVGLPDFSLCFHSKLPCGIIPSSVKMLTNASSVTERRRYSWRFSVCFMWFVENAHCKTENAF